VAEVLSEKGSLEELHELCNITNEICHRRNDHWRGRLCGQRLVIDRIVKREPCLPIPLVVLGNTRDESFKSQSKKQAKQRRR
jgi:hypothetical protein